MDSADLAEGVFEPVELDRVADAVIEQIETLILSGVLRPGEKLPPERDLSEALGVSRPKLREAFQVLSERGLVEIRRSEGAFVRELDGPALSPALVELFSRHKRVFRDFLEFRREQESFAAALAADRATDADRELLAGMLAEMDAAHAAEDTVREAALDRAFHMAVVELSHNTLLMHVMRSIYALMSRPGFYDRAALFRQPGAGAALLAQHKAIGEAVLAGDADRAARASDAHLDYVEHAFLQSEDEARRHAVARKRQSLGIRPVQLEAAHRRRR